MNWGDNNKNKQLNWKDIIKVNLENILEDNLSDASHEIEEEYNIKDIHEIEINI